MPHKLRDLSGDNLIRIFQKHGFRISFVKGSHCKLSRVIGGTKQILVIPRHLSIAKGTLKGIYRYAMQYIPEAKIKSDFYTE